MPEARALQDDLDNLRIDRTQRSAPRKPRLSLLWIGAGIAVVVAIGAWSLARSFFGATEIDVYRVSVPRSGGSGEAIVLQAAGYVVPHYRIEVASKVVGRVKWMGVEKGDSVKGGQEIVRLEDDEYQARLLESVGALESARARLTELRAGSRPEEIERAESDLAEAKAQSQQAKVDFERAKQLRDDGVVAEADFDEARFRFDALVNRVDALGKTLELLQLGPRQEDIDSAEAEVKRAEGSVAYNRTLVAATVIRAPVTGTVLERNVEVGELVTTGFVGERGAKGYVVAMADLNDIQVELDISQNDFARVFMNQPALLATDAYPDEDYAGEVVEISPEADRQKATVQVKVQILEPDSRIRPEMNANVSFLAPRSEGGQGGEPAAAPRVTIPAASIVDGNSVFQVVQDRVAIRPVRVSRTTASGVEIEEGLSGGEDIVLSPPEGLEDGARVKRREP